MTFDSFSGVEKILRPDELGLLTPLLSRIKNAIELKNEMSLSKIPENTVYHRGSVVIPSVTLTMVNGV